MIHRYPPREAPPTTWWQRIVKKVRTALAPKGRWCVTHHSWDSGNGECGRFIEAHPRMQAVMSECAFIKRVRAD